MYVLKRIALVTLLVLPLAGQRKPLEPKPVPVHTPSPVLPTTQPAPQQAPDIEKRRDRMRSRDREIDRMLKNKSKR
ncbi:MAG: hypothetical protein RL328_1786 [Acidobacteriota bacterium]|jgi:hypothetical protein